MPQIIGTPEILICNFEIFKTVIYLQVVALDRKKTKKLLEVDGAAFDGYIYLEEGEQHFWFKRKRVNEFI